MDVAPQTPVLRHHANEVSSTRERRDFPRCAVAYAGSCYGIGGSSPCVISEVSEAGVTVLSAHIAKIGEEFTVAWSLADNETPLQITCIVRDVSGEQAGLEFLDAQWTDRMRIRRFIERTRRRENA
jgi:PilZ domain